MNFTHFSMDKKRNIKWEWKCALNFSKIELCFSLYKCAYCRLQNGATIKIEFILPNLVISHNLIWISLEHNQNWILEWDCKYTFKPLQKICDNKMTSAPFRSYFQARVNYTTAIYGTCVKLKVLFTSESDKKLFLWNIKQGLYSQNL